VPGVTRFEAHALAAIAGREVAQHDLEPGLGGRVGVAADRRAAIDRTDGDHAALAGRNEARQRRSDAAHHAGKIDVDLALPHLVADLLERLRLVPVAAGSGHQHVEPAEPPDGPGERRPD